MREELKKYYNQRIRVRATVERYGIRSTYKGSNKMTILLKDITNTNTQEYLSDHIWFTVGKRFEKLKLISGDIIEFDARIDTYSKGYAEDSHIDYKLAYPTNIEIIERKFHSYQELYEIHKEEIERSYQENLGSKNRPEKEEKRETPFNYIQETKKNEKEQTLLTNFM